MNIDYAKVLKGDKFRTKRQAGDEGKEVFFDAFIQAMGVDVMRTKGETIDCLISTGIASDDERATQVIRELNDTCLRIERVPQRFSERLRGLLNGTVELYAYYFRELKNPQGDVRYQVGKGREEGYFDR
jgi:hypothetical protein